MRKLVILAVSQALLLAACASVGVTRTREGIRAKRSGCPIQVFTNDSEVGRPFEVVCLIEYETGRSGFHKRTSIAAVEKTKKYACKCGADAVILMSMSTDKGNWLSGYGSGVAVVRAIRFLDQPPR